VLEQTKRKDDGKKTNRFIHRQGWKLNAPNKTQLADI
jgi:hypothetical protein